MAVLLSGLVLSKFGSNLSRTGFEPEPNRKFGSGSGGKGKPNPGFGSGSGSPRSPEPGSNPNLKPVMTPNLLD
jgi:hypothetical protein